MQVRPLRVLLVDVPPARAAAFVAALGARGRPLQQEAVDGEEAFEAALLRRGWDAVLHGGDAPGGVPARKAIALVRLADAHLPLISVDPRLRLGDLDAIVRGLGEGLALAPTPEELPAVLERAVAAAGRGRRDGDPHRLLAAQQGVADLLAASPPPDELLAGALAILADTLGWTFGAVWRPTADGAALACSSTWSEPEANGRTAGFALLTRSRTFVPGRGLPGRAWAFRRPLWVAEVAQEHGMARGDLAARAGLGAAVAFPVVAGDAPLAVLELWARQARVRDDAVAALLTAVGRQLGTCIARPAHLAA